MVRWGMAISLKKCIGCYSCMTACKEEHFLPPGVFWSRLLISETGKYPSVSKQIYPILCNHCQDAPCVEVCPTGASYKRDDGITAIDSEKCVGCRYCLIACPYQQRTFLGNGKEGYYKGQGKTEFEILGRKLYPLQPGTVTKCNFCAERLDQGLQRGLTPGVDRDATPACVNICPTEARVFGDLDDSQGKLSKLVKEKSGTPFHPEHGTNPSVFYLK